MKQKYRLASKIDAQNAVLNKLMHKLLRAGLPYWQTNEKHQSCHSNVRFSVPSSKGHKDSSKWNLKLVLLFN